MAQIIDCDLEPIRVGPPEPPGPPPRQGIKWKRPKVLWTAVLVVVFVALCVIGASGGRFGFGGW